ncbi:MAG: glutaredoxin family protein [Pseudomonadota bacterium]|uniref:glutaredoxin family protein n=1 Tax=Polaromonas sp. TaxID=1869339 RepID=UPI00184B75F4|nr:glutaredoxin family protein [Polaromonas sp.]MBA3595332.1 glutaredoxin family protein [Polaromonas sp.]MDQ3272491.1 glutaredoxin family protein [Pseudomonadota bacterium]
MTSTAIKFAASQALLVLVTGFFASSVSAQQVFRIVGPDGKVTFSDQPPPASANARVTASSSDGSRAAANPSLPFELRRVAGQYPVTLYAGTDCSPCGSARSMLITRGIPFTEKTVITFEDSQALKRLSGESVLPFVTIGSQQLKGFSDAEWTQFLDAAGYPKSSVLPASYRQAAATPLVTVNTAPAAAATAPGVARAAAAPAPTPITPAATPDNPAGIRF